VITKLDRTHGTDPDPSAAAVDEAEKPAGQEAGNTEII